MNNYEILSIAISIFSTLIAVLSIIIAFLANSKSHNLSMGQTEIQINQLITSTKQKVMDLSNQMAKLVSKEIKTKEENDELDIYKNSFNAAVENNLTAYNDACAKYLDKGKVDRERFKKLYQVEIRQLVEKKELKKYFDSVTSQYKCILKVYDKWENSEK